MSSPAEARRSEIEARLSAVRARIAASCLRAGRDPRSAALIAVSKQVSTDFISQAMEAGQSDFAENYVQEAYLKLPALLGRRPRSEFKLHLTGPLQRNKVKKAVGYFDLIHTVDRLELAREIAKEAVKKGLVQPVLIQVNISEEDSKNGVLPENLLELYAEVAAMDGLRLDGLMAIGRYVEDSAPRAARIRDHAGLAELKKSLEDRGLTVPHLSMGMSSDYELAVECGATLVRVGTAIFGDRG